MANLFDYLAWRGDLSFTQSPLNAVDFLIFSQMSYLPFDGIVPGPDEKEGVSMYLVLNKIKEKMRVYKSDTDLAFKEDPEFIDALYSSNRFRNCQLHGFVNKINTDHEYQFSAICIYTGDDSSSVVIRGTDASIVGWKENFNMCFMDVIPAQLEAVNYLEKISPLLKGSLRIGGHSKGGNLAIYAASFCKKNIQKRITEIFSYDSPGFNENVIASDGYSAVKDRIKAYVPQTSVIGMLFEHGNNLNVIKSSETGLMQHSLYSWEIAQTSMIRVDKVTSGSRFIDKTLREWIDSLSSEDREKVIEAMYTILDASDVKSIHELENSFILSMGKIIKFLGNIDEHTRKLIKKTFIEFLRSARRNINTLINP